MLNDLINIDLHIHSYASYYKDGKVVENSTKDNLDLLIEKLEDHQISLCAITDHNRFDYEIYMEMRNKIDARSDKSILKKNLPGVEFDVIL
jgi:predicted metal-dependent phosphoesterase TrpH